LSARTAAAERSPTLRSRVTNGSKMIANVDGRTAEARRYRDLVISFADDLGGVDKLTEADKALCRQAAASVVAGERLQTEILSGRDVDLEQLSRMMNITTRLLGRLRTRHKPAKSTSPLAAHFANPPVREACG
jgi:hypothetical protein